MPSRKLSSAGPDAAAPPELDINGNPILAKNLFAAPASADTPPPGQPPSAAKRPPATLRPLSGGPRPGSAPRPGGGSASERDPLPGVTAGYDLAGNPLPVNAPAPGAGLYTPQPGTPGTGARGVGPHGLDPTGGAGYGRRYTTTVNGGLILALGIGGLVVPLLAPVAWVMGNTAVGAIDRGDANPAPRRQANAGRLCGIVGTALLVLGLGVYAVLSIVMVNTLKSFLPHGLTTPAPVTAPAPVHPALHAKPHPTHHPE